MVAQKLKLEGVIRGNASIWCENHGGWRRCTSKNSDVLIYRVSEQPGGSWTEQRPYDQGSKAVFQPPHEMHIAPWNGQTKRHEGEDDTMGKRVGQCAIQCRRPSTGTGVGIGPRSEDELTSEINLPVRVGAADSRLRTTTSSTPA